MTNAEHIKAMSIRDLAYYLAEPNRWHCGDCIALFNPPGQFKKYCSAFENAADEQIRATGRSPVVETHKYVNRDACVANMLSWLKAEADPVLWESYDHVQKESGYE